MFCIAVIPSLDSVVNNCLIMYCSGLRNDNAMQQQGNFNAF